MKRPRVAVIGAGWAGLAAAVELADWADITVLEAGRRPGGRARCIQDVATKDAEQDNGQHILLGAYQSCLQLMQKVGVNPDAVLQRLPLTWWHQDGLRMRCPRWPAPWHLLAGLLSATGLTIGERWHLLHAFRQTKRQPITNDRSVLGWLQQQRQPASLIREFWQPLVQSVMNTPIMDASMQVFNTVLCDSLRRCVEHSDLLLPRVGLSQLFPDAAWRWLTEQGAHLVTACRVPTLHAVGHNGVWVAGNRYDAAVIAVAPYHVPALLPDDGLMQQLKRYQYWPIYTAYLQFARPLKLPQIICSRHGGRADWLFDRERLGGQPGQVAAVISAQPALDRLSQQAWVEQVVEDVQALDPGAGQLIRSKVIGDKRATLASCVNLARPAVQSPLTSVYLAGDWMYAAYPATLESAVRSGVIAAQAVKQGAKW